MTTATATEPATTPEVTAIIERALSLTEAERRVIVSRLLASIPTPPNTYDSPEALRAELQRRWNEIANGTVKTFTIAETMEHLRNALADGERQ
jgi:putative addiction module component (TIGR02574 family)